MVRAATLGTLHKKEKAKLKTTASQTMHTQTELHPSNGSLDQKIHTKQLDKIYVHGAFSLLFY